MKVIGITGPTGAGKTTALNALVSLGGRIIDADAVYHTHPHQPAHAAGAGGLFRPGSTQGSWTES